MKNKLAIIPMLFVCGFISACSEKPTHPQQPQTTTSQSSYATKVASTNTSRGQVTCSTNDYQTASKCLTVKLNCPEGEMQCKNVALTITDKATGKKQNIKGEAWVNVVNMNFNGYKFNAPEGVYYIDLRSSNALELWNKVEDKMLSQDKITSFPDNNNTF